jgi:hypothetical protein
VVVEGGDGPGDRYVSAVGAILATLILLITCGLLITGLIAAWPPPTGNLTQILGIPVNLDPDHAIFIVVVLSGGVGGIIHALRSMYWYIGNRNLRRSWLAFYACVPVLGATLGLVFYIVARGGLLSGQASASAINPYGFCAIAALVGLFTSQTVAKLKEVFTTLFAAAEQGSDPAPPMPEPPPKSVQPE